MNLYSVTMRIPSGSAKTYQVHATSPTEAMNRAHEMVNGIDWVVKGWDVLSVGEGQAKGKVLQTHVCSTATERDKFVEYVKVYGGAFGAMFRVSINAYERKVYADGLEIVAYVVVVRRKV